MAIAPSRRPSDASHVIVAPSAARPSAWARRSSGTSRDASRRLPTVTARPSTVPRTPWPGDRLERLDCPTDQAAVGRRLDHRGAQRVLARPLQRCRQVEDVVLRHAVGGQDRRHGGPAQRQGAGLVEHDGVDAPGRARAPRRRGSGCPPRRRGPVPTMIAVGVARPIAHGQAMITTPMNAVSASVSRGSGPNDAARRGTSTAASDEDGRHEPLADPVGQALDAATCCPGRVAPGRRSGRARCPGRHASRARRTLPVVFSGRRRTTSSPAPLSTGSGSPVSIDSSIAERALDDETVDRHPVPGSHAQSVAGQDGGDRDVVLAVGIEPARGRRLEADEAADGAGRAALGAVLEPAAEEHEAHDDRGAVEVRLGVEPRLVDRLGEQRHEHASTPRRRSSRRPPACPCSRCGGSRPATRRDRSDARPRPG